jgi:MFS family permease
LLVVLGGTAILPSAVLYLREVLGDEPQKYAGYQFALRFGFKAVAGLLLGWLITKTHPRAGVMATTGLCLAGLCWGLMASGKWYLVSFGILGGGELYYLYYQNYMVSCSPTSKVRRNLAYMSLLALPAASAPLLFGMISDHFGRRFSIIVAALLLALALLLVRFALPRRAPAVASDRKEPELQIVSSALLDGPCLDENA